MDYSGLATHLKCQSDLTKIYPGVKIKPEDIQHAMTYLMTDKEREEVSDRLIIIEKLNKAIMIT